jgi:hypothetical protein
MRVSEGGTRVREAESGARPRRFGEAMRRAREAGADEARGAGAREAGARAGASRRAAASGKDAALAGRRDGLREEERAAPAAAPPRAAARPVEPAGAASLRAILRALPVAIDASRVRDGAPLSLSLGRALEVDLRAAPAGVELVLRPDPRLARAAEAELPALVASLRSRGIAVARAEVRGRGAPRAGGRAR